MSRTLTNAQMESTNPNPDEFNIYKEISQTNKNMGFMSEVIRTGIISGDISLKDNDNMLMFRSFTNNLCALSSKIMDIASVIEPSSKVVTLIPRSVEFNSHKSSLTNSVHNSDVTIDNGVAPEQSSCPWVSEFAGSGNDDDVVSINSGVSSSFDNNPRKRKLVCTEDNRESPGKACMAMPLNPSGMSERESDLSTRSDEIKEMTHIDQVSEYVSKNNGHIVRNSKYHNAVTAIEEIIQLCDNNTKYPYHAQSLVIFEHKPCATATVDSVSSNSSTTSNGNTSLSIAKFLEVYSVIKMTVIERPLDRCQVYVAGNLGDKYHFSCPTTEITSLYDILTQDHNSNMSILFIPRDCQMFESRELSVFNQVKCNSTPFDFSDFDEIYDGMKHISKNGGGNKRTYNSLSLGLQTMYSHQQHLFRYCMLPHSRPHIPTVKQYPCLIRKAIIDGYLYASRMFTASTHLKDNHPFSLSTSAMDPGSAGYNSRYNLRQELYEHLLCDDLVANTAHIDVGKMFESCTVQPTTRLGFHRDLMNCPTMDRTIALHFPYYSEKETRCISLLYYSRKCAGNYANRQDAIEKYLTNQESCLLTKVCLRSLLVAGTTIFNYQSSIFENELSLNTLGSSWERNPITACPDIVRFTGTSCFKHGAAFDKMGYYSIFLNVFLSMHYMGSIITTVDDSISLCMYFGLLCNGTSNLVATWVDLCAQKDFAKEWCVRKKTNTRIFKLLVFLETKRREKDNSVELIGSCKLPRFQYANYASGIIGEADLIHCYVKDHLLNERGSSGKESDINLQHSRLFKILSQVKGVGPLSFNQLWHSLSLCGVLPTNYIHSTAVAVGSGPAALIQTFDNKCKSTDSLSSKMRVVKAKLHKLGISSATDFFLENMMCELTRLGNKSKIASKKMTEKDRKAAFLSDAFSNALKESRPTKNPDLYYMNPFTGEYQHVFRVLKKDLLMRLSFLDNDNSSSVIVHCSITYDDTTGKLLVSWSGDYVRRSKDAPSTWFYS